MSLRPVVAAPSIVCGSQSFTINMSSKSSSSEHHTV